MIVPIPSNCRPCWCIPAKSCRCSMICETGSSRIDVGQPLQAAGQIAEEIDQGTDVVIVSFGQQEREGKGLAYLIERALSVDIPVVIAVPSHGFADWIKFVDGMSVKLHCNRDSLDAWWNALSSRNTDPMRLSGHTACEALK